MRLRTWNAYASNNSGSYTVVGSLPSEEVARETADAIRAVAEAHTAWLEADEQNRGTAEESPLTRFCREHGLSQVPDEWDEWPQYSEDNRPAVAVVGNQVIVHHDYTVTLPPAFGEFFYRKGGRVQHEENHAHHPISVFGTLYWGWSQEQRQREAAEVPRVIQALTAPEGLLTQGASLQFPPAWRTAGEEFGEAPLTIGAVFKDLIAGVESLRQVSEAHGAKLHVRLKEIESESHDPFAHLRPSTPVVPRFDVELQAVGANPQAVLVAMFDVFGFFQEEGAGRLAKVPCTLAKKLVEKRAQSAADALTKAGAAVSLVRNDG